MNPHFQTLLSLIGFAELAAKFSGTPNLSPAQSAALGGVKATVQGLADAHPGETAPQVAAAVTGKVLPFLDELALALFPASAPVISLADSLLTEIDAAVVAVLNPGAPLKLVETTLTGTP